MSSLPCLVPVVVLVALFEGRVCRAGRLRFVVNLGDRRGRYLSGLSSLFLPPLSGFVNHDDNGANYGANKLVVIKNYRALFDI